MISDKLRGSGLSVLRGERYTGKRRLGVYDMNGIERNVFRVFKRDYKRGEKWGEIASFISNEIPIKGREDIRIGEDTE